MNEENEISQASMSERTEVEIDPKPSGAHNGKAITKFLLSPNEIYAATWSKDDDSVYGWPLDKDQPFEFDYFINVKDFCKNSDPQLSAVSNDKLVAIESVNKELLNYGVIEIINLVTNTKIKLETLCLDKSVTEICLVGCRFYNNGNLVMGSQILNNYDNRTHYEVFIFPFKNLNKQSWKVSNSIACGVSGEMKAYDFTDNEKIMIIDSCGLLTQWNLNTLSFEKQYQLEWNKIWALHPLEKDFYAFNKCFTLFAVCLQVTDYLEADLFISVYLTENAMHLSQHKIKYENDKTLLRSEFISSDEGERLLLFFDDNNIEIRDPYHLQHCIIRTVSDLCRELSTSNKESLLMFEALIDEKIYNISNGHLWVQELTKQQWVTYLREQLMDKTKIRALPNKSQIENMLQNIIDEHSDKSDDEFIVKKINPPYHGLLVKWEIMNNGRLIQAQKFDSITNEWKPLEWKVYPKHLVEFEKPPKKFVYRCDLLYNEDLIIITSIGLLILSVWEKDEIRIRYYKGFPFKYSFLLRKDIKNQMISGYIGKESEYKKKQFFAKKSYIQKLLDEIKLHKKSLLPPPDFDAITLYYEDLCMDGRFPFKELIDDYIEDKVTMSLYGHDLLKSFFKNKDHQMMEKLYAKCIKINTEKDNFLSNFKLFEIVTFSINDISVKSPDLLNQFLSYTSFTLSSTEKEIVIGRLSSKSHLQNHRTHIHLSNIYFTNRLITFLQNIKELVFAFLEEKKFHLDKFHDIVKKIKNDKWEDINEMPFISDILLELTKTEIENSKKIQNLKGNDEKVIQEFKNFFSEEIEKLKTMIEELKN
ncbi:5482_t:CDS:2 [Cetraspora pellucida]|uniref:5482_t:CDS:1 n=1 Tax=Cetraspora pellucida TaxID=1433469 RepID=A0A9N9NPV6_9GLOM|nr:5482_t:CDS:2 [Cetraspora pellucida]